MPLACFASPELEVGRFGKVCGVQRASISEEVPRWAEAFIKLFIHSWPPIALGSRLLSDTSDDRRIQDPQSSSCLITDRPLR
ncbi:unnamed protein product [Leptosia nina]|uniref:Uncharacterized protein n=1 Tax=Leptosia nina TaxID=320188 RepID=A0AAV1JRN6_9NEOP